MPRNPAYEVDSWEMEIGRREALPCLGARKTSKNIDIL